MTTDERTALIQAEDAAQRYAGTTDGVTPNEVADIEAHAIRPPAKAALLAIVSDTSLKLSIINYN